MRLSAPQSSSRYILLFNSVLYYDKLEIPLNFLENPMKIVKLALVAAFVLSVLPACGTMSSTEKSSILDDVGHDASKARAATAQTAKYRMIRGSSI